MSILAACGVGSRAPSSPSRRPARRPLAHGVARHYADVGTVAVAACPTSSSTSRCAHRPVFPPRLQSSSSYRASLASVVRAQSDIGIARRAFFEDVLHPRPNRALDARMREDVEALFLDRPHDGPGDVVAPTAGRRPRPFFSICSRASVASAFRARFDARGPIALGIGDAGRHVGGAKHRHADRRAPLPQVVLQRFRERDDGMLGDVVYRRARRIDQASHRGRVHYMAGAARHEPRHEAPHAVDHAPEVHADGSIASRRGCLPRRRERRDAGVVADEVGAAEVAVDELREALDVFLPRDVDLQWTARSRLSLRPARRCR